jgi:pimeloyl-ACP methyl ester carboxylesterase
MSVDTRPRAGTLRLPVSTPQAVIADPPRDEAHPARNRQLVIPSGPVRPELGRPAEMNALFLLASGAGPKPTLLLLHGLPGNERNLDLAQAVRRAGWNVLTFTYRGAWGSEGTFSIQHAIADAAAALAFLRSPRAAADFEVDPGRIVIAGHSMGGYAAAATAAKEPVAGLILLDAWDIGKTAAALKAGGAGARVRFIAGLNDIGHALGPITAEDIANGLLRRGHEWQLTPLAPSLAKIPVLSLYATHGGAGQNRAFAAALKAARPEPVKGQPAARVTATELATDHSFADKRIALAAEVVRWLQTLAPPR